MSQTRAQRRKQQKKKAREKGRIKRRNVEHNAAPKRWRLDVFYGERWVIGFRHYRKWEQVQAHLAETEELRKKGIEVIPGRVISLETGQMVKEIEPSPAKPEGKGALPDKLAGDPKGVKKSFLSGILK